MGLKMSASSVAIVPQRGFCDFLCLLRPSFLILNKEGNFSVCATFHLSLVFTFIFCQFCKVYFGGWNHLVLVCVGFSVVSCSDPNLLFVVVEPKGDKLISSALYINNILKHR